MLVYSDAVAESNVSVLSFDPAAAAVIGPPRPVTTGTRFWLPPQPSSGGQFVALTQAAIADHEDVFLAGRDAASLRRLTDDASRDRDPQISPDGQRVAFASDRGGSWGIWTIGTDGGQMAPVSAPDATRAWTSPHWSPDGASIAAWEEPGHRTVIFDAGRTSSTPRTVLPSVPGGPTVSLSLASNQMAWSSDRGFAVQAGSVLAIYSFETGAYRTTPMSGAILGWIPNTALLLLNDGWERRFTIVDTSTWRTKDIAYPSFIPEGDVRFGLSPDGRTLALAHATYKGDIWLMSTGDATARGSRPADSRGR
jgi:Tol biopolymer transport system component